MISPSSSVYSGPHPLVRWLFSSIGKKTIVALSGIVLVLFVIGHLLGNLTVFLGPDIMNAYAKKLHDLGPMLWVARIGLLIAVGLHIIFTMLLWKENQAARSQKYRVFNPIRTTIFARTMRLSGLIVLAFIVFHLAHFTLGIVDPSYLRMTRMLNGHLVPDVYGMVIRGFQNIPIVITYVVSLFLLAFHLSHGIGSLFQTLGITNQQLRPRFERVSRLGAWLLFAGYAAIPISILVFGFGRNVVK